MLRQLQSLWILLLTLFIIACPQSQKRPKNQLDQPASTPDTATTLTQLIATMSDTLESSPGTVQDRWDDFRAAKDSVDSALARNDFQTTKLALLKAAQYALELNRKDIAAWQLNNIGYYSIEEFKKRTDYSSRMKTIEAMRRGPEKFVYTKETKQLFRQNLPLLIEATKYLEEAYELDKEYDDNSRTRKIYSNLTFIDWIRNFVNDN
jgi:hypothetical protein